MEENSCSLGNAKENISNQNTVVDTDIGDVGVKVIPENSDTEGKIEVLTQRHCHSHSEEKSYVCKNCNKTFAKSSNFKEHLLNHTEAIIVYGCKQCEAKFSKRSDLIEHKLTHTGKELHSSPSKKTVSGSSKLKDYFVTDTGEIIYVCRKCKLKFYTESRLIKHRLTHPEEKLHSSSSKNAVSLSGKSYYFLTDAGEKIYVCIKCKLKFSKKSNLIKHRLTHPGEKLNSSPSKNAVSLSGKSYYFLTDAGEKIYMCMKCELKFCKKSDLIKHRLTHPEKKLHSSPSESTVSEDNKLKEHLVTHTEEELDKCEACHKAFPIRSDFFKHLASHLDADDDDGACYFCKICLHYFPNVSSLNIHLKSHVIETPYASLDELPLSEKFKQFLAYMKDNDKKPYECEACNKRFFRKSDLTKHLLFHTENEKPYGCIVCREPFAKISDLNTHLKTHPVEKSYGCDLCVKRFSDQSQLEQHIPTHSAEKPCVCDLCQVFFDHAYCSRYIIRAHKNMRRLMR